MCREETAHSLTATPEWDTFSVLDLQPAQWKDWIVSGVRLSLALPQRFAYTPRASYPYYFMTLKLRLLHKLIVKNWTSSICGVNDTFHTSLGMTSSTMMKIFAIRPTWNLSHYLQMRTQSFRPRCRTLTHSTSQSDSLNLHQGERWRAAITGMETCLWSATQHLDSPDLPWHGCHDTGVWWWCIWNGAYAVCCIAAR